MPELPEVETIARTSLRKSRGGACGLRAAQPFHFEGTIPLGKVVGGVIGVRDAAASCCCCSSFGSDPLPPVDEACPSGSLARCLACGDERITGLGFHLK
ncbi:MAG: hypothetical protein ACLSHC_06075 [Bilophila wadsworthia]